jgi:phosphatidylserine decarboxylase
MTTPDGGKPRWRDHAQFLLSNPVPRRLATQLFARFSRIEHPLVACPSIALWRRFGGLDLSDARRQRFASVHACFTRELREDARSIDLDADVATSPCDGIIGACGRIDGDTLIQAKGLRYRLAELFADADLANDYVDGWFVTLRLTPNMYHRFHAPHEATIETVTYIGGDLWNVNPATLRRVPNVFCRNERAVLAMRLHDPRLRLVLVPVGAILVGSLRLRFLELPRGRGMVRIACNAGFQKGEEIGWFEHGSTIIVVAPRACTLCPEVREGARIRMGRRLLKLPLAMSPAARDV